MTNISLADAEIVIFAYGFINKGGKDQVIVRTVLEDKIESLAVKGAEAGGKVAGEAIGDAIGNAVGIGASTAVGLGLELLLGNLRLA
jgi:hypothetical protein